VNPAPSGGPDTKRSPNLKSSHLAPGYTQNDAHSHSQVKVQSRAAQGGGVPWLTTYDTRLAIAASTAHVPPAAPMRTNPLTIPCDTVLDPLSTLPGIH
jgi:hypothetical protein